MKRNALFIALAALGLALAPAGRLAAQTPAAPSTTAHAHHGSHGGSHGARGAHAMHGGDHAPAPAMLLRHRAELGLSEAQAAQLQGLRADDAAGARAVLTPEQRARLAQLHRSAMAGHHAGHSGRDGDCCGDGKCCEGEECCRDGECRHEECCRDGDCCKDGKCSGDMECCRGMDPTQRGAGQAPRP